MKAEFVRTRPWQARPFVWLLLEMVRGRDPWADRILARPWSTASLLEFAYLLDAFVRFDNYFIMVDGSRAGVVSISPRRTFSYIHGVGLLPQYQRLGLGPKLVEFVEAYVRRNPTRIAVGSTATSNRPVNALLRTLGGRPLGLSTTTLSLGGAPDVAVSAGRLTVHPLARAEAARAWRRWRLHEVEQAAGVDAVPIAAELLESPPRGLMLACCTDGAEIGVAHVQRRAGGWEASVYPGREFWEADCTQELVNAIAHQVHVQLEGLTVTRSHARVLDRCPIGLRYERHKDQERRLVFVRFS
jgi:ribosomal protein S18 acetylase RimI-like enzyme